jgi:hypothetical protein
MSESDRPRFASYDEAKAYYEEHALTEAEQAVAEQVLDLLIAKEGELPGASFFRIVTELLMFCVEVTVYEQCLGDAVNTVAKALFVIEFLHDLLDARLIVQGTDALENPQAEDAAI